MLSKHPGRCRFPHGHSRRIDVVLASEALDANDMVCDFKALKLALGSYLDGFDHAMAINADDPARQALEAGGGRVVVFEGEDPTTEVMARRVYEHLSAIVRHGSELTDPDTGLVFTLPGGLQIERVRVTETSSSWAEYAPG